MTHSLFGGQHTIGLDIKYQLVQVSTLLNTSIFHCVAHAADRAKGGIQNNAANSMLTAIIAKSTDITRHIATAFLYLDLHLELALIGQGRDVIDRKSVV